MSWIPKLADGINCVYSLMEVEGIEYNLKLPTEDKVHSPYIGSANGGATSVCPL